MSRWFLLIVGFICRSKFKPILVCWGMWVWSVWQNFSCLVLDFRVPTVLEKSFNFRFSLKSPWKLICPWKVLQFRGPSLKFQFVILDFFSCVFWTESLNGYSKLRGTRANFPPKNSARFAYNSLQVKYFSSPIYNSITIVIPTCIYVYYVFQCINLFQNEQSLLLFRHNNKLVYPPELSRIAGFCTNSIKKFSGGRPQTPFQAELFEPVL